MIKVNTLSKLQNEYKRIYFHILILYIIEINQFLFMRTDKNLFKVSVINRAGFKKNI